MQIDRSRAAPRFALPGGQLSLEGGGHLTSFKLRDRESDLREIILVCIKYWRWIAGSGFIACFGAIVFILLAQPLYTSTVTILIDASNRMIQGSESNGFASAPQDPNLVESQLKIITSPAVLKRVIVSENLDQDSEFIGSNNDNASSDMRLGKAIAALVKKMAVKKSERTYVIDVELSTSHPEKSAKIANAIAVAYIADQKESRIQANNRDIAALTNKITQQIAIVKDAFSQVQKYKQENKISDVNGKLLNEQELVELTTALNLARLKTRELKSRADQWQKYLVSGRLLQARPEGAQSGTLERLWSSYADIIKQQGNYRTTLGDRHPALMEVETQLRDIRRLMENETRGIIQSVQNEYQIALNNEKELARRLEESHHQTDNINLSLVKLKELERNAEAERLIQDRLLKLRDALNSDLTENSFARIIAAATPPDYSSYPKTLPILAISIVAGLFMGAGGVLFKDFISDEVMQFGQKQRPYRLNMGHNALRSENSFQNPSTKAPWIVAIPALKNLSPYGLFNKADIRETIFSRVSTQDLHSDFIKAIDQTRDHLIQSWLSMGSNQLKTILVTSEFSHSERTNICVNLAMRFSQAGLRVVLVDAHFNHPSLSELITETAKPDLIRLSNQNKLIYKVQLHDAQEFSLIPILPREDQIIRRLEKKAPERNLSGFRNNFDIVIIDGPDCNDRASLKDFQNSVDNCLFVLDQAPESFDRIQSLKERFSSSKMHLSGFLSVQT